MFWTLLPGSPGSPEVGPPHRVFMRGIHGEDMCHTFIDYVYIGWKNV